MKAPPYETMDHTADFGLRVFASGPENLYRNAALALFDLMIGFEGGDSDDPGNVLETDGANRNAHVETLAIAGDDPADLMVNWLRELLYLLWGRQRVVTAARVLALSDAALTAEVDTAPFDRARHEIKMEIKAVTYHGIFAGPVADGWEARIILDV